MGPLGIQETVFIFILALLLFGPKKLPELGKTIGKALTEFRRASNELKGTFDREMSNLEKETESLKQVTHEYTSEIQKETTYDYGNNYDYNYYDPGADGYQSADGTSAPETSTSSESTVSASAVQGAESSGTQAAGIDPAHADAPPAVPNGIPGTVPVESDSNPHKPAAA